MVWVVALLQQSNPACPKNNVLSTIGKTTVFFMTILHYKLPINNFENLRNSLSRDFNAIHGASVSALEVVIVL